MQFYGAINWLVSQGVNVINMSAGIDGACLYDEFCEYIDLLSIQHDVHFVASAGNYYDGVEEDPIPIPSYNFSRPA